METAAGMKANVKRYFDPKERLRHWFKREVLMKVEEQEAPPPFSGEIFVVPEEWQVKMETKNDPHFQVWYDL